MPTAASMRVGTTIDGRYTLQRAIGRGGFGTVFEAVDEQVGRHVAVKAMAQVDDEVATSFRREALLLASVQSPYIVRVLDAVLDRELPYLVMELLDGPTLHDQIRSHGPLGVAEALGITAEILQGLRDLHQRAIVHLDVKPPNVILTKGGAKLIDFGISRPGRFTPWDPSMVQGTPPYLAPELLARREPDARTDLYGVGVVLYEMLSGQAVHPSSKGLKAVLKDIREGRWTPLHVHCPWLDTTVTAFVRMALAADPEARFSNAEEMLVALDLVRRASSGSEPSPVLVETGTEPMIASKVAKSRVEALVRDERVRQRFLRHGGRPGFFDDLETTPWVAVSEYCRVLDSAYAVLGQAVLARVTRERIVEESRTGPFEAVARATHEDLGALVEGYWHAAFRDAGGARVTTDERGLRLTLYGVSSWVRSSPGWRAALSGSLLGVLDVAGLSGDVRLRDEDGTVSWFMDLDGAPSRLQIDPVAPAPEPDEEVIVAGRFRLRRPLGAGSFGRVWEARDLHLDRPVAIKWAQGLRDEAAFKKRISKLSTIRSPHVVQVIDIGTADDGRLFLVMELATGPTLATISGDMLPFETVCSLGKSALGGLSAIHDAGVIHGSVVPSNVVLAHAHGERVLKWIGLASEVWDGQGPCPIPPAYAAPELGRPGAAPTTQTDVFGLGAILFELIAGEPPFSLRYYSSPTELREAMEQTPWSVVAMLGRIPPDVSAVLRRALTPDPAERYRDATEMRTACASVFG